MLAWITLYHTSHSEQRNLAIVNSTLSPIFSLLRDFHYSECDLWYRVIQTSIIFHLLMRVFYYSEVYYCKIPLYSLIFSNLFEVVKYFSKLWENYSKLLKWYPTNCGFPLELRYFCISFRQKKKSAYFCNDLSLHCSYQQGPYVSI